MSATARRIQVVIFGVAVVVWAAVSLIWPGPVALNFKDPTMPLSSPTWVIAAIDLVLVYLVCVRPGRSATTRSETGTVSLVAIVLFPLALVLISQLSGAGTQLWVVGGALAVGALGTAIAGVLVLRSARVRSAEQG